MVSSSTSITWQSWSYKWGDWFTWTRNAPGGALKTEASSVAQRHAGSVQSHQARMSQRSDIEYSARYISSKERLDH
jgi:hypothetical protein